MLFLKGDAAKILSICPCGFGLGCCAHVLIQLSEEDKRGGWALSTPMPSNTTGKKVERNHLVKVF